MNFQLTNEQKEQMKNEVLGQYFNFEFEKKKLKSYLGESLYDEFKEHNVIIAGGMIGSLFSNKEINDVDVYFRTNDELYSFALETIEGVSIVSHTKKATQYLDYSNKDYSLLVQLIHFRTYVKPEDIFDTYDFTVCMGAFDFKTESFILHPDFLKHNSQRILKFNQGTSYPLISAIRVDKYKNKGYTISKAEYFRIILSCMTLNIKSHEQLKEHLGGMYGESYDRLIEQLEESEQEFDLNKAIEMIGEISLHDSYFEDYNEKDYDSNVVINDLDKLEKKFIKLKNNNNYRVLNGEIHTVYDLPNNPTYLDVNEFFEGKKFYKFVKVDVNNAKLYSFYDKSFEYKIGEIVEAKEKYNGYGGNGKLFFNELKHLKKSTYSTENGGVVIEVEVVGEDVISYNKSELTASKCKVLRVVPEEEWIEYVKPKNNWKVNDLLELF